MIKDRLLLAALSGFLAAVLANLTLYLINLAIPGPTINMPQLTLEIFLNPGDYTMVHKLLGFIWSTTVGGFYAIFYLVALKLTCWNHMWLKAIIIITVLWLVGAGPLMRIMDIATEVRDNELAVLAFFVAHLFFATFLSFFMKKFDGRLKNYGTR